MPKRPRYITTKQTDSSFFANLGVLIGRRSRDSLWVDEKRGYCLKPWEALLMALLLGTPANPLHDARSRREVSLAVNLGQALCLPSAVRIIRPVAVCRANGVAATQQPLPPDSASAAAVAESAAHWAYAASNPAFRHEEFKLESVVMKISEVELCLKQQPPADCPEPEKEARYLMSAYLGDLLPLSQLHGDIAGQFYTLQGALFSEYVDVAVIAARLINPKDVPPAAVNGVSRVTRCIFQLFEQTSIKALKHVLPALNLQAFLDCVEPREFLAKSAGNYDLFRVVWDHVAKKELIVHLSATYGSTNISLISAAFLGDQRVFEFLLDNGDTRTVNIGRLFDDSAVRRPDLAEIMWMRFRDQCPNKGDTERWKRIVERALAFDGVEKLPTSKRLEFLLDRFKDEFDVVAVLSTMLEQPRTGGPYSMLSLPHVQALHRRGVPLNQVWTAALVRLLPEMETIKFLVEVAGFELSRDDGGALLREAYLRSLPCQFISWLLEKGSTFPPETDRAALMAMVDSQLPHDTDSPDAAMFELDSNNDRLDSLKLLFASGRIDPKERMFPRGRGIQHRLRFTWVRP